MKTPFPNEQEIAALRQKYLHGTMLRLIRMVDDPNPIKPGTVGEVDFIDDAGNIHMIWRDGGSLSLIPGAGEFEVLPTCPKCGKQYAERPAMSREDNKPICPMCGYKETITFFLTVCRKRYSIRSERQRAYTRIDTCASFRNGFNR